VPDGVPGRFGRAFERVAVPAELVRADCLAQRLEVRLQVAAAREDADGAEQVPSGDHGGRAIFEQVVQEAERVLRLELERGMDGVQGGFRFHVVEFSVLGFSVSELCRRMHRRNPSSQSPCQHENEGGNASFPARCYINC